MLASPPESNSPLATIGEPEAGYLCLATKISSLGDESIAREAERLLRASPYSQLALVDCHTRGEALVLSGRVNSYYLKQVAQFVVSQYNTKLPIENEIVVNRPPRRP